jgi:hypothetical protein
MDDEAFVAGYEELRGQVLSGQRGPGLALLMRRGIREWMNAYSLCTAPRSTNVPIQAEGAPALLQDLRTEVVLILAGMVLQGCQEART